MRTIVEDLILCGQRIGREPARQQRLGRGLERLAAHVRQHDDAARGQLMDDLAAGSAGRRQCFRVSNNGEFSKLSFTFRQRLPNRNPFRTNS